MKLYVNIVFIINKCCVAMLKIFEIFLMKCVTQYNVAHASVFAKELVPLVIVTAWVRICLSSIIKLNSL